MSKNKNYRKMYNAEEQTTVVNPEHAAEDTVSTEDNQIVCPEKCEYVSGTVVGCTKLNVREHPNADANVKSVIDSGSEVKVCTAHNYDDWYEVCTASGVEGYCMAKFIAVNQ